MEEQIQKTNAGKGLGITAFIIAVVAIVISFIDCLSMFALIPGVLALIFAIIAFFQAKKGNGAKGLIIAALIISFLSISVASWKLYEIINDVNSVLENNLENFNKIDTKSLEDELNNAMNESLDSLNSSVNQMQNGLDSVK